MGMLPLSRGDLAHCPRNLSRCRCRVIVLPEPQDSPACVCERACGVSISLDVLLDLVTPPRSVGFRPGAVNRAPVPKASIYEHGDACTCECEVRSPTSAGERPVDAEAQAQSVHCAANRELAR